LTFVLPRLMGVFEDLGTELPAVTLFVMSVSAFCQRYWLYIIGAAVLIFTYFRTKGISTGQKKALDGVSLRIPLFGNLILKSEIEKFLHSLELLYENGISLHKAVEVAGRTVTNIVIQQELEKVPDRLRKGETLTASLAQVPYISDFVTNMVSVGEESGKLGEAILETANFYEKEAAQVVKIATALIEPVMILLIGGIIGFIIIAMLLPIFEISALAR
jgi:type IV pilus assembly protein PilC